MGAIELWCSLPARPFPSRPGEFRRGLEATATAKLIASGEKQELIPSDVNVSGVGSRADREWIEFSVHIPLSEAELDAEAERCLRKMQEQWAQSGQDEAKRLTDEQRQQALKNLRELIPQHRTGLFRLHCKILDGAQELGAADVELEVVFKGRISDQGFPGASPAGTPAG